MTKKSTLLSIALIILSSVIITYSNSFHNSFHFDDFHTINSNSYITQIGNIPLFFKDGTTSSSLPSNQSYRPIVTTSLALDYWLGNGIEDTFYFHLSMFLMFILQGFLMYWFYREVFEISDDQSSKAKLVALLSTGWYLLHPANAETINYIIARSDSISTMFILLAFMLFIFSPLCRKWQLYLIPALLAMLTKPIGAIFAPLLFIYIYLFEEKQSLLDLFRRSRLPHLFSTLKKVAPALLFTIIVMVFIKKMDPPSWTPGGTSLFHYVITQPYVIWLYFSSFFLPIHLSADTDVGLLASMMDIRFFGGSAFLMVLILIAFYTSVYRAMRPISFGIIWFLITLLPTSVIPLAEVMNDHRVFLPYVGLMMSVGWSVALLLSAIKNRVSSKLAFRYTTTLIIFAVLIGSAYGTYQRNKVWYSEESLWRDVSEKSPRNGRGIMNYGLTMMAKGDYTNAEIYFKRALALYPNYGTLLVNLGILNSAIGKPDIAETYFLKGISVQPNYPDPHFFYARFLMDQKKYADAAIHLKKTLDLYSAHLDASHMLMTVYIELGDFTKGSELAKRILEIIPHDPMSLAYLENVDKLKTKEDLLSALEMSSYTPEELINRSLAFYQAKQFDKCIQTAQLALIKKPEWDLAYNNMCAAYNQLKQWNKAIEAGEQAVKINPFNQLAANNLAYAKSQKASIQEQ